MSTPINGFCRQVDSRRCACAPVVVDVSGSSTLAPHGVGLETFALGFRSTSTGRGRRCSTGTGKTRFRPYGGSDEFQGEVLDRDLHDF